MNLEQTKSDIKNLTANAIGLIPATLPANLPEIDGIAGVPNWHDYEKEVWALGEQVRQTLIKHKALRGNAELLDLFLQVCINRNAKRGRQSFIMLFEHKHCMQYAPQLITQINDDFVCGHVLKALNKMQVDGYAPVIENYREHKIAWIRNEAKKYLATRN